MIRRIELVNFMSHKRTVIEPADGLTVLVGPNNCGKSAVVAALQILCHNDSSTYVTRHGEKECSVKVTTDDDHVIEWARKTSPRYLIDGELFDRLRNNVPDELLPVLRIAKVSSEGGQDFDVHFGEQKSPVFLLDKPASHAAQFFASSSDASLLVDMQKRHRTKVAEANHQKRLLAEQIGKLSGQIEALSPATDIDERVKKIEGDHEYLLALRQRIIQGSDLCAALSKQQDLLCFHTSQTDALSPLQAPPLMQATEPLELLIRELQKMETAHARSHAVTRVTADLPPVTQMQDTGSLARLITQMQRQERQLLQRQSEDSAVARLSQPPDLEDASGLTRHIEKLEEATTTAAMHQRTCDLLAGLTEVPTMLDPAPLKDLILRMEKLAGEMEDHQQQVKKTEEELLETQQDLRDWATQQRVCPTCGGEIDPERLISNAGMPGGHCHG